MKRSIVLVATLLLITGTPIEARAESSDDELDRRIAELRTRREAIDVRTPRAWKIAGGVITGAGLGLAVSAGAVCAAASAGSTTECRRDNAALLAGIGGGIAAIGLTALISSAYVLSGRRAEVREIDRSIMDLRRTEARRDRVRFGIGPTLGDIRGIAVAFVY